MWTTLAGRLLGLAPAARGWLAAVVLVLLGITATYVGQGLLVAHALGRIFAGDGLGSLTAPVLGVLGLQLARAGLAMLRAELATRAAGAVKLAVRQALVGRLLALGPGWRQARPSHIHEYSRATGCAALPNFHPRNFATCARIFRFRCRHSDAPSGIV